VYGRLDDVVPEPLLLEDLGAVAVTLMDEVVVVEHPVAQGDVAEALEVGAMREEPRHVPHVRVRVQELRMYALRLTELLARLVRVVESALDEEADVLPRDLVVQGDVTHHIDGPRSAHAAGCRRTP